MVNAGKNAGVNADVRVYNRRVYGLGLNLELTLDPYLLLDTVSDYPQGVLYLKYQCTTGTRESPLLSWGNSSSCAAMI